MQEVDHNNLEYKGSAGEPVTVTVTPNGTTQLVAFTLDGNSQPLPPGGKIRFNLKNASGQQTTLQLVLDFNANGSYEVVVENVTNCSQDTQHVGRCLNTVDGPPKAFLTLVFSVA